VGPAEQRAEKAEDAVVNDKVEKKNTTLGQQRSRRPADAA